MSDTGPTLSFSTLIQGFNNLQYNVIKKVKSLANQSATKTNVASFMLVQFMMSKVSQIGDSLSNLIATFNSSVMATVRNQRAQ